MIIGMLQVFRPEITLLREELSRRVRRGGALEIGPLKIGELGEEIHSVKKQLDETKERISKLFLITMSPDMYRNLRKLSRPQGSATTNCPADLSENFFIF